jgi:hypothetical protein
VGKRPGGGRAELGDLLSAGLAFVCLGILLSLLATATTTTTGVASAPAGKALGDADGEALVRLDNDATSGLLTPGEEAREAEELSARAALLMSMLVVAASSFFTSGLVVLVTNSSLKGVAHPSLGVPLGSRAAACGGVAFLGVFLL